MTKNFQVSEKQRELWESIVPIREEYLHYDPWYWKGETGMYPSVENINEKDKLPAHIFSCFNGIPGGQVIWKIKVGDKLEKSIVRDWTAVKLESGNYYMFV